MLFVLECCRCWGVLVMFGNVVLAGVQCPILFIHECCSMEEVGRLWSWRANPIQCLKDPIHCLKDSTSRIIASNTPFQITTSRSNSTNCPPQQNHNKTFSSRTKPLITNILLRTIKWWSICYHADMANWYNHDTYTYPCPPHQSTRLTSALYRNNYKIVIIIIK